MLMCATDMAQWRTLCASVEREEHSCIDYVVWHLEIDLW